MAAKYTETFAATGAGTTYDLVRRTSDTFALAVKKTGSVTSWTVLLEGSLDGTNWTTLLTHTNASPGDALIIAPTAGVRTPVNYLRLNCSALTLGTGTAIVATFAATPGVWSVNG